MALGSHAPPMTRRSVIRIMVGVAVAASCLGAGNAQEASPEEASYDSVGAGVDERRGEGLYGRPPRPCP
jgi:hypothetical protein